MQVAHQLNMAGLQRVLVGVGQRLAGTEGGQDVIQDGERQLRVRREAGFS